MKRVTVTAVVAVVLCAAAAQAQNTVTFDNKSGKPALVKLVGPTSTSVAVEAGGKTTVEISAGHYFVKIRYGTVGDYSFSKGDEFDVVQTATTASRITITLHRVLGGNYGSRQISAQEFDAQPQKDAESKRTVPVSDAKSLTKGEPVEARTLIERLSTGSLEERRLAATELGKLPSPSNVAVQALIEAMRVTKGQFKPEEIGIPAVQFNNTLADAIKDAPALMGPVCDALVAIGSPARTFLIEGLLKEDRWTRFGCAWVLGRLQDKAGEAQVVASLCSILEKDREDINVLVQVADSLRIIGSEKAVGLAERALKKPAHVMQFSIALLELLAKVDPSRAAQWCLSFNEKQQPAELRTLSCTVAGGLNDAATLRMLLNNLDELDPKLQYAACSALGKRKATEALEPCRRLALDKRLKPLLRVKAAWTISSIGDSQGTEILKDLATNSGEDYVRSAASKALEQLSGKVQRETETDDGKFGVMFVDIGGGSMCRVD